MRDGTLARILAVAGATLRESARRRIVLVAVVMSAGYLVLYGLGAHYVGAEMSRVSAEGLDSILSRAGAAQLLYVGLLGSSFIVALAAVFASAGAIAGEIESGTAYALLARPVRRAEFVLGKALGLGVLLAGYAVAFDGAVIGIARWQLRSPLLNVPGALALMALEPVVLLGLSLLGSARLPTLANGVLCAAAFGIGFVGGFIEQIGGLLQSGTMVQLGVVSSLLVPVDAVHRAALSILLPGGLLFGSGATGVGLGESTTPSVWMIAYAVGYTVVAVALAARTFGRRDL